MSSRFAHYGTEVDDVRSNVGHVDHSSAEHTSGLLPGEEDNAVVIRRWSRHPRSVSLARAELRKALAVWGLAELEDTALVALSELVTNAVLHAHVSAGREIETRFRNEGGGLRIEVHDASDTCPEKRSPDTDAEHGRGLALMAALADQWGVSERIGPGKSVWAVLTVHGKDGDARC